MTHIDIGARNISFVQEYLKQKDLSASAQDVGSDHPRKVLYFPDTGAVKLRRLRTQAIDTIQQRERE
ncbi:MAG: chemotaxis protein CheD [Lentisphaeria bacterium]|jgi:chemotaxis protein CheD